MSFQSLIPNHVEDVTIENFDDADEYGEGTQSMRIVERYYEDPNGKTVLLESEIYVTNKRGTVIRKVLNWWDYEHVYAAPNEFRQEIHATLWLPSRAHRTGLHLVEKTKQIFWYATIYAKQNGFLSYRTVVEGEVIYNTSPAYHILDADQRTKMEEQGLYVPTGPMKIIVGSAREWSTAVQTGGIVEEDDYPQVTIWRKLHTSEHRVTEMWASVSEVTITHHHLHPGSCEIDGPHIHKKPKVKYEIPIPIDPPILVHAREASNTVQLLAEGGGGVFNPSQPPLSKVVIEPDTYRFYKRVDSMPARSLNDDPYDVWDTPPTATEKYVIPLIESGTTTTGGGAASSLPTPVPTGETDDTTEPDNDRWDLVVEVDNAQTSQGMDGFAEAVDLELTSGAGYTYRATVVCNGEESDPSNEISLTYSGTTTVTQGIKVTVRKNDDGNFEIDAVAPADREAEAINPDLSGDYGETVTFEVPVDLGRSDLDGGGLDADEAAILLGYEIGQAQMARSQGLRRILITPVIPILGIQRGQYITAPVLSWKSHGAGLIMSSNTVETELRIDGWGLTISADGNGFEVASDPIDCVEVDV